MPKHETLTSSDSDSENEKKFKEKLRKEKTSKRKAVNSTESSAAKKPATSAIKATVNSEEDGKIFLGKMKYVTVRPFKNMIFVDIREHYEKDGELKPGKKGISLQAEQWHRLKENIDLIDAKIQELC